MSRVTTLFMVQGHAWFLVLMTFWITWAGRHSSSWDCWIIATSWNWIPFTLQGDRREIPEYLRGADAGGHASPTNFTTATANQPTHRWPSVAKQPVPWDFCAIYLQRRGGGSFAIRSTMIPNTRPYHRPLSTRTLRHGCSSQNRPNNQNTSSVSPHQTMWRRGSGNVVAKRTTAIRNQTTIRAPASRYLLTPEG